MYKASFTLKFEQWRFIVFVSCVERLCLLCLHSSQYNWFRAYTCISVNTVTRLIRSFFPGPKVTVLSGDHCTNVLLPAFYFISLFWNICFILWLISIIVHFMLSEIWIIYVHSDLNYWYHNTHFYRIHLSDIKFMNSFCSEFMNSF